MGDTTKRPIRNLLVTGGCGFIGTNFIDFLLNLPDLDPELRIINLDKLTYAGVHDNLDIILNKVKKNWPGRESQCHFVQGDICNESFVHELFDKFNIDAVCHFAAESHVDKSITAPGAFIHTNIVGTFNLLEAVRARKDRMVLFHHVSTDEVFGSLGKFDYFSETTPYDPSSPYSASKASSDHLVRAFYHTYHIPVTISNCSNNYGPFQFPEKLIPLMLLNAIEGKKLPVYGKGLNIRDWLHVADHCRAVWLIMNCGEIGETYAVGGECEKRNIEVVQTICELVNQVCSSAHSGKELISFVDDKKIRPGHDFRYAIDFSKIQTTLGWSPDITFEEGLTQTIRWYLEHEDWVRLVRKRCDQWVKSTYGEEY